MKIKHEFALFVHGLSTQVATLQPYESFVINDALLVHRITRVLRLTPNNCLILFDQINHANVTFKEHDKKKISFEVENIKKNIIHQPILSILLPLLKRDHLERAIYSCTELGATSIQLITTDKTQTKWSGQKEVDRLHKITVAAAEQSKNFAFPTLHEPISLNETCANVSQYAYFFDPNGKNPLDVLSTLQEKDDTNITLMVGPEGDLTLKEKQLIKKSGFVFLHLTPTILQAHHAIALGCGIFRTML